jgi:D-serine deaminase-like pyridoxal phosphate-dependent protein
MTTLRNIETPALVLDRTVLDQNLARMQARMDARGVGLRPHVKTTKSIDVLRRTAIAGALPGPITVSTLKEAEYFLEHGVTDILYAVGIVPGKLAHAAALTRRGANLTLILDSVEAVHAIAESTDAAFPVLIELDVDGHRSGVSPESTRLIEIAQAMSVCAGLHLRGVMTHAGESYNCASTSAIVAMAEQERSGAVRAAERLRAAGFNSPVVSVGSTPTATFATDLHGVTEVRAGVYMFHDLVMAGLGVCEVDDIALSVLVSVIGHQSERGWIITDGGWMALSRDRGTAKQRLDQGFGLVRGLDGRPLPEDLIVTSANQEHGILSRRDGAAPDFSRYPIGSLLRVLPNHACATGAQHSHYHVIDGHDLDVLARWERINGW